MAAAESFPEAAREVVDPFEATLQLHIEWPSAAKLTEGATLTPTQVQDIPHVCFEGAKDKLYSIVLSDPDAPSATEPKFREWQHWLHINAPADNFVKGGESITAYVGSAPGKGSGYHRYVAVLYEQTARIEPDEARIPANSGFAPRRSFNSRAFAAKYALKPVATLTYKAEFDDLVPELHARLQPPVASS